MALCVCFDMARELSRCGSWAVEVQTLSDRRRDRPDDRPWFECLRCDSRYVLLPTVPVAARQYALV